ncbi:MULTISPECIES: deoxyuridine 5'-triphosphate nucleotidohydrolase [Terrabacteria group]|uniref:deoxyuridine 5'-triphosphate nucleotidohydrolase n=1 Tax=Bacillati TaxID=1783272 RepID=UPI00193AD2A1|nr:MULTISPECIES: deoxyuridine 5'-triphosphate nucleotidohydrolase [Terrabacteria group]MBW9212232.1 hypothetical protein [Trueperella sp. zg.1013]QRG86225.1 deoxyuridine 5'-triphosphate nucleotidohydrolase [Bulleidia sp. zg-1006]
MAIAKFEKVSYEQFKKDFLKQGYGEEEIEKAYQFVQLPKRSTAGSAGYDFVCPLDVNINQAGQLIPTGIRARIKVGYVLLVVPRSSLGFKCRLALDNSIGVIDRDYYQSDNEGHILVKVHASKTVDLKAGDRFVQGIFVQYGLAEEEEVETMRNGGIGSTNE